MLEKLTDQIIEWIDYLYSLAKSIVHRAEGEEYSRVETGIYVGGSPTKVPPHTAVLLNLTNTPDPRFDEVYIYAAFPIQDADFPGVVWLENIVQFIIACKQLGRTVLIHCHNGVSRSGMCIVAYEMATRGLQRDTALAYVRQSRPEICPNPSFMAGLLEYEKHLEEY